MKNSQINSFRRKVIIKLIWSLLVIVLVLAGLSLFYYDFIVIPTTGNVVINNGDYVGTGYASPEGKFTIDNSRVTPNANQMINLKVAVDEPDGYVYAIFYVFNYRLNRWMPFAFSNSTEGNTNWIKGHAETSITLNATSNLINADNYIVTYSCKKENNVWECGYNPQTGENNQWMLHKFSVSGITTPAPSPVVNTNCVLNTDCASRNCTNHVCGVAVPLNVIELTNCARLDTSGATYKLMNNVFSTSPACEDMECSFCLSIIADNIILDGNGFQTESILIKDYSENYKGNENIITRDKINEVTLKNINAVTLNVYDESLGKLNIFNSNINSISLFGGRTDVIGELNADNFVTMQSPLFAIDKISLSNSNLEGIALNVGHDYSGGDGSSPNSFGYGGSISLINSQAGDLNVNGDDSYGGSGENGWNAGQVSLTNSQVGNIYANGGNSDLFGGNGGTISLDHSSASNIYANGGNGEGYNGGNGGTLSLISNLGVSLDNLISVNGGSGGNAGGNGGILFFDVPSIEYIFNITLIGGNTETNSNGGNGGSITTRGIVADIDFIDCSGGNNNPPNFDRLCIGD